MCKSECLLCGRKFVPSKYRPYQRVCSNVKCQYIRQRKNERAWREANPNYFKSEKNRKYQKKYRNS